MLSSIESSSKVRDRLCIYQIDDVHLKVDAEQWLLRELSDYFTFDVPGAKFMPSYQNKMWDGKIRLLNLHTNRLYVGLLHYIFKFCEDREYDVDVDSSVKTPLDIDPQSIQKDIESLNLPFELRDYQFNSVVHGLTHQRALLVSPTASGKSLIIYTLLRLIHRPTLIIVPTTSLVQQMYGDFEDYSKENGWDVDSHCHKIFQGTTRHTDKQVVISTWQSIYKMGRNFFDRFDCVIGDEAHHFKAKSLTNIMTKTTNCPYKFGLTGSLDGTQTNETVLQGLFGKTKRVAKTRSLMNKGQLASLNINVCKVSYGSDALSIKGATYPEEINWIVTNPYRNQFITSLVEKLKGNTLVLYQYVEKHGIPLHKMIEEQCIQKDVQFVSGKISAENRERIRKNTESSTNTVIVASMGTFSTGINIRNLHNIVFASPSKSQIRILQSIGRGLRKGDNKQSTMLYDIVDDLSNGDNKNYALEHGLQRLKLYLKEGFDFKEVTINLESIKDEFHVKTETTSANFEDGEWRVTYM